MNKSEKQFYVYKVPLSVTPAQRAELRMRFKAASKIYNAVISYMLPLTKEYLEDYYKWCNQQGWKTNIPKPNRSDYKFKSLLKTEKSGGDPHSLYDISGSDIVGPRGTRLNKSPHGIRLSSQVANCVAERAVNAVKRYMDIHTTSKFPHMFKGGKRKISIGKPKFIRNGNIDSIDCKHVENFSIDINKNTFLWSSAKGTKKKPGSSICRIAELELKILWNTDHVYYKKVLQDILSLNDKAPNKRAIQRRVIGGRERYELIITLPGKSPWNTVKTLGTGTVGIDIGPSKIAIVNRDTVTLESLQEKPDPIIQYTKPIKETGKKIRLLQRRLDRQTRRNNPDSFNEDGTWKRGKRITNVTNNMKRTRQAIVDLQRRHTEQRKNYQGKIVNDVCRDANVVSMEKINYVSWQRGLKMGKSVRFHAPGSFHFTMKNRIESLGGTFVEIETKDSSLSQYDHQTRNKKKKPLSQRFHILGETGERLDRDKYSALLAACWNGENVDCELVEKTIRRGCTPVTTAINKIKSGSSSLSSDLSYPDRGKDDEVEIRIEACDYEDTHEKPVPNIHHVTGITPIAIEHYGDDNLDATENQSLSDGNSGAQETTRIIADNSLINKEVKSGGSQ